MGSNNFRRGHALKIIVGILLILIFFSVASAGTEGAIKLGAFNLQIFGPTKASNPEVMNIISKIIRNYDVIAVEEIRDASQTALPSLNISVNSMGSPQYDYVVSERLGRTTSKEQYAYFYNTQKIEVIGNPYVFPDSEDLFEREPFVAHFKAKNGGFDFVSITIHTKPDNATQEINDLPLVVDGAKMRYQDEDDFIIMGDLNADCDYFDENGQSPLKSSDYIWIINNSVDTTTKSTVCTYDRIIITTPAKNDFTGESGVFRFDTVYNLTYENTTAVSDHYPVYADFWSIDLISPSAISNLTNITYAPAYINFTWTNPYDHDYHQVMLFLNGVFLTNITAPQNYFNVTGLTPDTEYELGTHTLDSSGNVNQTWVNKTARTAPLSGLLSSTIFLKSGWNLISVPLNLTTWKLGNETVVGKPMNVTPANCISSLYQYNTTSALFEKSDHFADWGWWPATGSESFTALEPGRGYWVMAQQDCTLTFTGTAPNDRDIPLNSGWNLIGWYSMNDAALGEEAVAGNPLNVTPVNSLTSIYRYNTTSVLFEKSDHFLDWGWWPATGSEDFKELEPGRGYWVMTQNDAKWRHKS